MTKRSRLSTKTEAQADVPPEAVDIAPEAAPSERPMSERQRRRLAEQERKAREAEDEEQRLAREAEEAAVAAAMADIRAQMSDEAAQPPATLDDLPLPAPAALPAPVPRRSGWTPSCRCRGTRRWRRSPTSTARSCSACWCVAARVDFPALPPSVLAAPSERAQR